MNAVDLFIGAAVLLAIVSGFRTGFVATLWGLISLIAALFIALAMLGPATELAGRLLPVAAPFVAPVAFVVLFIFLETLFALIGRSVVWPVVRRLHRAGIVGALDRVLGVVPAVTRALLLLAIGLAAAVALPISTDVRTAIDGSRAARTLIGDVATIQPYLSTLVGQPGSGPLFVTKLAADQRETLDLPDDLQLAPDPVAEQQMLDLVNEERTARGIAALALDPRLVPVARQHSEEMFQLKYFGHQSPVRGSPFDRIAAASITYTRAGENLAYARSVGIAHRGLMDSQGHRENILRPEFTRIGIGVVSAGAYGLMFTQLFLTP